MPQNQWSTKYKGNNFDDNEKVIENHCTVGTIVRSEDLNRLQERRFRLHKFKTQHHRAASQEKLNLQL